MTSAMRTSTEAVKYSWFHTFLASFVGHFGSACCLLPSCLIVVSLLLLPHPVLLPYTLPSSGGGTLVSLFLLSTPPVWLEESGCAAMWTIVAAWWLVFWSPFDLFWKVYTLPGFPVRFVGHANGVQTAAHCSHAGPLWCVVALLFPCPAADTAGRVHVQLFQLHPGWRGRRGESW